MKLNRNPVLRYTPLGAAREVTGSSHLLEYGKTKVLADCGMYQGNGNYEKNFKLQNSINLSKVDCVVLSHAHLDHCGRLPFFVKHGFKGTVFCTPPTKHLAELVMRDSAKIMAEDSKRRFKVEPLYDNDDVDAAMQLFDNSIEYNTEVDLSDNFSFRFHDAGHILGSAYVEFSFKTPTYTPKLVFSGDLGNKGKYLITDPVIPDEISPNFVIMESTYGSRSHKPFLESIKEFYDAINDTFQRGGNVYIPTLAVERAQELLFIIREGIKSGAINSMPKVVLDSPMAIGATKVFRENMDYFNEHARSVHQSEGDIFSVNNLEFSDTRDTSVLLNDVKSGMILLAGSGMCSGGRIIHHLKHALPNPNNTVIFTSYAPPGTLARKIIDLVPELEKFESKRKQATTVNIFGEEVKVNSRIVTINGFSGHADQDGLVEWLSPMASYGDLKKLFIVHGNHAESMIPFAGNLVGRGYSDQNIKLAMPECGEPITLIK